MRNEAKEQLTKVRVWEDNRTSHLGKEYLVEGKQGLTVLCVVSGGVTFKVRRCIHGSITMDIDWSKHR